MFLPNVEIMKVWYHIHVVVASKHQNDGSMALHAYSSSKFPPSKLKMMPADDQSRKGVNW